MSESCPNCDCHSCRKEYGRLTPDELRLEAEALEERRSLDWTPARNEDEQRWRDIMHLTTEVYMRSARRLMLDLSPLSKPFGWSGG